MYIYKPNPVCLPIGSVIKRAIPKSQSLTKDKKARLDFRTIFYDVFIDRETRQLRAIGPRLYNLKHELFPLTLFVEGEKVKFRIDQIERLVFLESNQLPESLPDLAKVTFKFKIFDETLDLNWRHDELCVSNYDDCRLTITTLQKDNHFEWISDWVLWHHRLHDVKRLVLYDNGSSGQTNLINCLKSLESYVKIVFVDWSFPYGSEPFEFAQHGSLNHCRLKFSIPNSFCINLDVDEYLVIKKNISLLEYSTCNLKYPTPGTVTFQEYLVPNIRDKVKNDVARFFDFPYRFKNVGDTRTGEQWEEFGRMKYIYMFGAVGYNATHRTISEKNKMFSKRYSWKLRVNFHVLKFWRECTRRFVNYRSAKPRIDTYHASENELFFLHFLGLNTGWKTTPITIPTKFNSNAHIKEPLITKLARKARLITRQHKYED